MKNEMKRMCNEWKWLPSQLRNWLTTSTPQLISTIRYNTLLRTHNVSRVKSNELLFSLLKWQWEQHLTVGLIFDFPSNINRLWLVCVCGFKNLFRYSRLSSAFSCIFCSGDERISRITDQQDSEIWMDRIGWILVWILILRSPFPIPSVSLHFCRYEVIDYTIRLSLNNISHRIIKIPVDYFSITFPIVCGTGRIEFCHNEEICDKLPLSNSNYYGNFLCFLILSVIFLVILFFYLPVGCCDFGCWNFQHIEESITNCFAECSGKLNCVLIT